MKELPFIEIDAPHLGVMEGESGELANDGIYGKALAEYLQTKLTELDYDVPWVVCEDWGWYVPASLDEFSMNLCVYGFPRSDDDAAQAIYKDNGGQPEESNEEPAGIPLSLCVCVGTKPGRHWSWRLFRRVDNTAAVSKLHNDVLTTLQGDPKITVIQCTAEFPLGG